MRKNCKLELRLFPPSLSDLRPMWVDFLSLFFLIKALLCEFWYLSIYIYIICTKLLWTNSWFWVFSFVLNEGWKQKWVIAHNNRTLTINSNNNYNIRWPFSMMARFVSQMSQSFRYTYIWSFCLSPWNLFLYFSI